MQPLDPTKWVSLMDKAVEEMRLHLRPAGWQAANDAKASRAPQGSSVYQGDAASYAPGSFARPPDALSSHARPASYAPPSSFARPIPYAPASLYSANPFTPMSGNPFTSASGNPFTPASANPFSPMPGYGYPPSGYAGVPSQPPMSMIPYGNAPLYGSPYAGAYGNPFAPTSVPPPPPTEIPSKENPPPNANRSKPGPKKPAPERQKSPGTRKTHHQPPSGSASPSAYSVASDSEANAAEIVVSKVMFRLATPTEETMSEVNDGKAHQSRVVVMSRNEALGEPSYSPASGNLYTRTGTQKFQRGTRENLANVVLRTGPKPPSSYPVADSRVKELYDQGKILNDPILAQAPKLFTLKPEKPGSAGEMDKVRRNMYRLS